MKVFPGDNLMVHKALDMARPGDVVVIDAERVGAERGARRPDLDEGASPGDRRVRGRRPGPRPAGDLARCDFPVFARGVTPIGPLHRGPGEINYPIACGGIVVNPGDIVVGDLNGVVVIPRDISEELLQRLTDRKAAEADYTAAVGRGDFNNSWVDTVLESNGVAIEQPA